MRQRIIRQLFSSACQLTTLALDITRGDEYSELHYCLEPSSDDVPEFHPEELRVCVSLRELTVHLNAAYFLECLVNHVPLLEKLRVHMRDYLYVSSRPDSNVETLIQTDGLWRQKVGVEVLCVSQQQIKIDRSTILDAQTALLRAEDDHLQR